LKIVIVGLATAAATGGRRAAREDAVAVVEIVLHTLLDKDE
jgi:hypothetical protein